MKSSIFSSTNCQGTCSSFKFKLMKTIENFAGNKLGLILAFAIIQDDLNGHDPEDNKNKDDNAPNYQNPFYDPDSDQGSRQYNAKEDPHKDDNEPIGEDYPLNENIDEEEEEENDEEDLEFEDEEKYEDEYEDDIDRSDEDEKRSKNDLFDDDELNNTNYGNPNSF